MQHAGNFSKMSVKAAIYVALRQPQYTLYYANMAFFWHICTRCCGL